MDDGKLLLNAILENPEDDTVRLAYADYLDEIGNPERAGFIRFGVEIAGRADWSGECESCRTWRTSDAGGWAIGEWAGTEGCGCTPHHKQLVRHYNYHPTDEDYPACMLGRGARSWNWTWTRGFISSVCLPWADFEKYAAEIFSVTPIDRISLSDKTPAVFSEEDHQIYVWERILDDVLPGAAYLRDEASRIHPEVFDLMSGGTGAFYFMVGKYGDKRHSSETDATGALSDALVQWGRIRAGLKSTKESRT